MNLGTRLKNTLEERGQTVTQFAKEASVPAQTIYALINRDSNKADMDILVKLLTALNTDFFTFMEVDDATFASAEMASPAHTTGAGRSDSPLPTADNMTSAPAPENNTSFPVSAKIPTANAKAPEKERIIEKIVEKIVVKEVPAQIPDGKHMICVDSTLFGRIRELAKDEGIEDDAIVSKAIEAYLELGFGYRQRPLRSIMRDYVPKTQRSGDMDSFLL